MKIKHALNVLIVILHKFTISNIRQMKIGVISAMHEEIESLLSSIESPEIIESGNRKYYSGKLWGIDTVLAFSRWGKVASSSTVTNLILKFNVDKVLFTGVAGAIDTTMRIGDVVIGDNLYQHDMDSRPLFDQFEIPLTSVSSFKADRVINNRLIEATENFLNSEEIDAKVKRGFSIYSPKVKVGDIASGDKFISSTEEALRIKEALPQVLCVEMEGGAVAQVCYEYGIPFSIIRTISDTADHLAEINFLEFTKEIASKYSKGIIKNYYSLL